MVIISGKKSPIDNCLKRLKYFHISSLFESLICLVFIPLWDRGSLASLVQPPSARKTKKLYLDLHKFSIFCSHFFLWEELLKSYTFYAWGCVFWMLSIYQSLFLSILCMMTKKIFVILLLPQSPNFFGIEKKEKDLVCSFYFILF